ncbi:MAG: hypothetical protein JNM07_10305 [Phycisphaerae bacterium]|nr:hypothetical protein [Phycisphaerae bacterium]
MRRIVSVAAAVIVGSGIGRAQPSPTPPTESSAPAQPQVAPPAEAPVLSGPKVATKTRPASLVERDAAGKIVRLDVPPPVAALDLLDLTKEQRAAADEVVSRRAAILDTVVRNNLETLVKLNSGARAANPEERLALLEKLGAEAEPLKRRGGLQDELMTAIGPEHGVAFRALIQEYGRAVFQESVAEQRAAGGKADGKKILAKEVERAIGQEVRRSYDRVFGAAARDFDALLKELAVTPEQEGKIRKVVGDEFTRSYGKLTPAQRTETFWKVFRELDETQRRTLIQRVR